MNGYDSERIYCLIETIINKKQKKKKNSYKVSLDFPLELDINLKHQLLIMEKIVPVNSINKTNAQNA